MSKTDKLMEKLRSGNISASEVRTLLGRLGWVLKRTRGSHEHWTKNGQIVSIATHDKHVPGYQVRQILTAVEE